MFDTFVDFMVETSFLKEVKFKLNLNINLF